MGNKSFSIKLIKAILKLVTESFFWPINLKHKIIFFLLSKKNINAIAGAKDDITVIIAVRDKPSIYIKNSLKTLRDQTYSKDLIKIVIVDYSSAQLLSTEYIKLSEDYDCKYIRVENKTVWNKSNCLNIAIKEVDTKYILSSDADILFESNYIEVAIKELKKDPMSVILCEVSDLPKGSVDNVDVVRDYGLLKTKSTPRARADNYIYGKGINMGLSYVYKYIRGYDENYILWGSEDDDLIKRLKLLGLRIKSISNKTTYLHQWHIKHNGLGEDAAFKRQVIKNSKYAECSYSIVRNVNSWGEHSKEVSMQEIRYIVLSTPRTGTNLLFDLLALNGLAAVNPVKITHEPFNLGILGKIKYKNLDIEKFIKEQLSTHTVIFKDKKVMGIKIFIHHIEAFLKYYNQNNNENMTLEDFFDLIPEDIKFIQTIRKDKISQAISYYKAKHTDLWFKNSHTSKKRDVPFDGLEIKRYFSEISRCEKIIKNLLVRKKTLSLQFTYEDFSKNPKEYLLKVASFLGVVLDKVVSVANLEVQRDENNKALLNMYKAKAGKFLE